MAQVPRNAAPRFDGLYRWLYDRAEQEDRQSMPLPGNAARLEAFRRGEPVNVPVSDLPKWAREGVDVRSWSLRAVVSAEGAVAYADDSGEWLEENGL
jgi:hypothetical protein